MVTVAVSLSVLTVAVPEFRYRSSFTPGLELAASTTTTFLSALESADEVGAASIGLRHKINAAQAASTKLAFLVGDTFSITHPTYDRHADDKQLGE